MPTGKTFSLLDRYVREEGPIQLTGVQALVRLLFDQVRHDRRLGRNIAGFVSGYEGSPLAGFDLELGRRGGLLSEHGLVHQPGLNEELAATAVFGTQLAAGLGSLRPDGIFGVWYGKSPGLDRAADAFRHANMAGTHPSGGAVAFVGDDPAAKSSSVPSASEHVLADLGIPVLYPADPQDVLHLGRHAVELSRACGLWVAIKMVANVADASGTALLDRDWQPPTVSGGYRHQPNGRLLAAELAALERSLRDVRLPLALDYIRASGLNHLSAHPHDQIGIVTAGKTYLDVRHALGLLGLSELASSRVRLLKLGAIYPVDPLVIREFATGLTEIVVVEEKRGILEPVVKSVLYGVTGAPPINGKSLFSAVGELQPEQIATALARRIPGAVAPLARRERTTLPMAAARTPYFCSGCPHNSSLRVPAGSVVGGGIGCHTMALFMSPEQVGEITGITQMGGEGAQWIGMAPFVDVDHWIQNIGDGTFLHSGSLAIRAAVAANVNITYKLLHNSAVAMTGGQPATGRMPVERLAELLLTEGVAKVVITTDEPARLARRLPRRTEVRPRSELVRTQQELARIPGVTVIIHDQECAAELRRERRRKGESPARRIAINELICEGCGDCGTQSNCLSVRATPTEFGRKARIHQASCNFDESCVSGRCPSFLTVQPSDRVRSLDPPLSGSEVPAVAAELTGDWAIRIAGIGGTGVVTVAQIIATAAFLAGHSVRGLDQTGLAQKGGAVVSDLFISSEPQTRAAKLSAGECDLYLAADLVVGADPENLHVTRHDRTVAVAATAEVPTGGMVAGEVAPLAGIEHLRQALDHATREAHFLDAHGLAQTYCGSDQYANIVLLGAAYQLSQIPIPESLIEQAIELNGQDVGANLQAFRRGRQAVVAGGPTAAEPGRPPLDPALATLLSSVTEPDTTLHRLLDVRANELAAYQNDRYARRYVDFVAEIVRMPDGEGPVAEAVARQLYRLMAYKDEYEVARLSLDNRLRSELAREFGPDARYRHLLQPPILNALGLRRKVSVGRWFHPVFHLLRQLRVLRASPLDPFGHTALRRRERMLIEDYRHVVRNALTRVPGDPAVLELAGLPEVIRGFDEIKLASIEVYQSRQAEILADLEGAPRSGGAADVNAGPTAPPSRISRA